LVDEAGDISLEGDPVSRRRLSEVQRRDSHLSKEREKVPIEVVEEGVESAVEVDVVDDLETGRDLMRLRDESELDGFEGSMTLDEELVETETLDNDGFERGAEGEDVGGARVVRRVSDVVEEAETLLFHESRREGEGREVLSELLEEPAAFLAGEEVRGTVSEGFELEFDEVREGVLRQGVERDEPVWAGNAELPERLGKYEGRRPGIDPD